MPVAEQNLMISTTESTDARVHMGSKDDKASYQKQPLKVQDLGQFQAQGTLLQSSMLYIFEYNDY